MKSVALYYPTLIFMFFWPISIFSHYIIWRPVYSDTNILSQCMSDFTGFTVYSLTLTFLTISNVTVLKQNGTIYGVAPRSVSIVRISTVVCMLRCRESHESPGKFMTMGFLFIPALTFNVVFSVSLGTKVLLTPWIV